MHFTPTRHFPLKSIYIENKRSQCLTHISWLLRIFSPVQPERSYNSNIIYPLFFTATLKWFKNPLGEVTFSQHINYYVLFLPFDASMRCTMSTRTPSKEKHPLQLPLQVWIFNILRSKIGKTVKSFCSLSVYLLSSNFLDFI